MGSCDIARSVSRGAGCKRGRLSATAYSDSPAASRASARSAKSSGKTATGFHRPVPGLSAPRRNNLRPDRPATLGDPQPFERGPNLLLALLVEDRLVLEPQNEGVKPQKPHVHIEL
jgi:hypothetical protein